MQTIKIRGEKFLRFGRRGCPCGAAASSAANRPETRFLFVLLLVFAGLLSGCRPPGARALIRGKELLEQGKCEQAVGEFRTATALLKTNAIAFNYLGLALQESGQLAEAETAYHRALALNHELAEARYNLGCLYLAQNKIEPAKSELTAFTLRRPEAPEGWTKLGTTQLRGGRDPLAAERSFSQALHLKPQDAESLTGIGLARLQRNHAAEAIQWFRNALKAQPDYAPALLNLAVVADQHLRDKSLALQHYRLYLALKPARPDSAAVQKVVQQLEQESTPRSVAAAMPPPSQLAKSNPAPAKLTFAGQATSAPAPAPRPSLPSTEKIAERPPPTNLARSSPIEVAVKSAPPTNETPSPSTVSPPKRVEPTVPPKPAPARAAAPAPPLPVVEVAEDQVFKAAQDMPVRPQLSAPAVANTSNTKTQAVASPSAKSPKRGLLSKINPARIFSGDQAASTATPLRPGNAASPDKTEADPAKPQAAPGPQSIARYKYLSPAKPKPGDRSQAERVYAEGLEARRSRRLSEAIRAYQRATQLDPAYYEAYFNLGVVTAENGDLPAALSAYEHALAIEDRLDARYNFALALKQSNYPIDARIEFEKLTAAYPNESRANLALGNLYAQQFHDPAKAREHYLKVLAADPQNPQASTIRYWLIDNPPK